MKGDCDRCGKWTDNLHTIMGGSTDTLEDDLCPACIGEARGDIPNPVQFIKNGIVVGIGSWTEEPAAGRWFFDKCMFDLASLEAVGVDIFSSDPWGGREHLFEINGDVYSPTWEQGSASTKTVYLEYVTCYRSPSKAEMDALGVPADFLEGGTDYATLGISHSTGVMRHERCDKCGNLQDCPKCFPHKTVEAVNSRIRDSLKQFIGKQPTLESVKKALEGILKDRAPTAKIEEMEVKGDVVHFTISGLPPIVMLDLGDG
jgi:hypothetical protein